MKNLKINRKRITALTLSMMLVLQQSFALQVLATSITNADKTPIAGSGNTWNITPDAVNGDVGFKQFGEINLDQNNILNFIYTYLPQRGVSITWNEDNHNNDTNVVLTNNQTIDTFVNLVDGGVNINGIVNTLESVGGGLKSNGNLIFVTPNGFVVGASGVINAGNLAVFTPTTDSYTDLKNTLALPQSQPKVITVVNHVENNPVTPNAVAELSYEYGNTPVAETTNATFELRLTGDNAKFDTAFYTPDGNPNHEQQLQFQGTDVAQYITNNGQIIARGNVLLSGGKIDVSKGTNTTGIMAGVSNNDVLTTNTDAEVLFSALVNTNNNEVTTYNADKGNIFTTSYVGTNMGENTHVRNLARNGEIKVRDFGRGGINFEGTLYNNNLASMNTQYGIYIWNANTSGTNTDPGITVTPSADIKNNGQLQVYNSGAGGMNIEGKFYNNIGVKRNDPTVLFQNIAGDMKIGHNYVTTGNIESNIGDVKIDITGGGSLLNNGVAQKHIVTTYGADLDISVVNGSIGDNIRGCDGGVCTGIGRDARDLTKSVNTSIDGKIKAISKLDSNEPGYSSDKVSLANIASLGIDMHVDQIKADGKVILLADSGIKTQSSYTGGTVIKTTGLSGHSILNTSTDSSKPNVEGTSISMIASKDIGETGNPLTFRQNGTEKNWDGDNATLPHVIDTEQATGGVDMLAKGNIDVYGMDADDGTKMNTNVCAIIARGDYGEGHINAEFSGDVYIEETIAPSTINITTRGKHMVVNHLGEAPHTYSSDYGETDYYAGKTSAPTKAKLVALDLGSELIESEKPKYEHAADSTIVVYNGTINGQGNGRPAHEQDLTLVADNAYAGGYYFNLGKHRGEVANENPSNPTGHKWNPSTVTEDNRTNPIMNEAGTTTASIRGKAVRPVDVTAIRPGEEDERNYYYGGSEQGGDPGYDGVNNEELNGTNDPDKQQTTEDDDNLVIPKNEPEPEEPIQLDSDTDTDVDTDIDNDTDTDNDIDTDTDTDNDIDTDTDIDTDNDTDNDDEIDIPDPEEQQVDTDSDTDTDVDTDIDNDTDTDNDIDTDT
ncbi:leukotoxin LktA family filamentous adhesin, partial [bacterium]|nr:leukotoxin LktA family filamentous adhesin [bacterium]